MLLAATLAAGAANTQADEAPAAAAPVTAVMVNSEFSTNINEVLKLTQAGLGDDVVIAFVKNAQAPYDLKVRDILALKKTGLSRACLGHHTFNETVIAKFDANGDVEPILMVE